MERRTAIRARGRGTMSRLALAAGGALVLAACGGPPEPLPGGNEPVSGGAAEVSIRSFAFVPPRLVVDAGACVRWTNRDGILHTVTTGTAGEQGVPGVSEDTPARPDGMLDEQLKGMGAAVSFRFREPGTYAYYCAIHAGMTGTVVVR